MAVKCEKCGKSFDSREALEQHLKDYDHGDEENEEPGLGEKLMQSESIGLIAIVALVIGVGFLAFSVSHNLSQSAAEAGATDSINYDGEPYMGTENASVTIAYFGDYNCPSCEIFEQRVFPDLQSELIEGGDIRFVKKNFAVINQQSPRLAQASQSVWNQVKDSDPELFWEWHTHMYDNQESPDSNWATQERIIELTQEIEGIEAEQVRKDLNSGTYNSEIRQDQGEGQALGVKGTPTFIIYGEGTGKSRQLVGPQPVSEFSGAIQYVRS